MIVIKETGGEGFDVYLEGDIGRIGKVPVDQYTPAEFYGDELFRICFEALQRSGVIKTIQDMKNERAIQ